MTARPIEIMLIDDNPGDVRLTVEALKEARIVNNLITVHDGNEALTLLKQRTEHATRNIPDLILLDLNLPGMAGHELLRRIKRNPAWQHIPVAVLTNSDVEQRIIETRNIPADYYVTRPVDLHQVIQLVNTIPSFQLSIVKSSRDEHETPI